MSLASWGHLAFAVTMIMLGVLGLVKGDFTPTWSGVPEGLPARDVLAYLCAFVSLVSGIGLLWRRARLLAARFLLVYLLVWLLVVRVSRILAAPTSQDAWWAAGDTSVMAAATWILYIWFAGDRGAPHPRFATGDEGVRIARVLYGLALIPFGVAHFTYLKETVALVPGWLPAHTVWAFLTGGAFLAAGVALLIGVLARLATALSALQMGLFTVIVWLPIVLAGPTPFQWSEFIDSWALTAGAWVVADSYRGAPWFAVGRRWPAVEDRAIHCADSTGSGFPAMLRFDVFGRMMGVERQAEVWALFSLENPSGRRLLSNTLIPGTLTEAELPTQLADLFHESARPDKPAVRRL